MTTAIPISASRHVVARNGSNAAFISIAGQPRAIDPAICNVTPTIAALSARRLHADPTSAVGIMAQRLRRALGLDVPYFDALDPVVSTRRNFDDLGVVPTHPSRRPSDTYYLTKDTVLRTHSSVHQIELLQQINQQYGADSFLVAADVYRRDTIDRTHYPVFHQLEGLRILETGCDADFASQHLRDTLSRVVREAIGVSASESKESAGQVETRWVDAYFPFTEPSYELELRAGPDAPWIEVLGCGVTRKEILSRGGRAADGRPAWAFGIGLERLAMIAFKVPDVRTFWSTDPRVTNQFRAAAAASEAGARVLPAYVPVSNHSPCIKDVSLWISSHGNDACDDVVAAVVDIVRDVAGDTVESVDVIDRYACPTTARTSLCFRIMYRAMDRTLSHVEVNAVQERVRHEIATRVERVELR